MTKRAKEAKTKRDGKSSKPSDRLSNPTFSHDFLQAILEQQKQEFEHQQKLQQEQQVDINQSKIIVHKHSHAFQEQERKRQELAYLKQLEMKKRQEEKLLLIEQRKAEKNAEREKKIVNKFPSLDLFHSRDFSKRNIWKSFWRKKRKELSKICN